MSTIASHLPLNNSETVKERGYWFQKEMAYGESNGHVTLKGHARYPNTLSAQYLENSWRCYLAIIVNYY